MNVNDKTKSSKNLIQIILAAISVFLICINIYVAISTTYASFAIATRVEPVCTARLKIDVKISDYIGKGKKGNNADIPNEYHKNLTLWNAINSLSIGISSSFLLLFLFLATGNNNLLMRVTRKHIIGTGIIGAIIFISLEAGLIYLTVLIFQSGEIINYEKWYFVKHTFPSMFDDSPEFADSSWASLVTTYGIAYCQLDSTILNYWQPELVIAATVLAFINFVMISVFAYIKLSSMTLAAEVSVEDGHDPVIPSHHSTSQIGQKATSQSANPSTVQSESTNEKNDSIQTSKIRLIGIIVASTALFLICISLYISFTTSYVSTRVVTGNGACTPLVPPDTKDPYLSASDGLSDKNTEKGVLNYNQHLVLWSSINSVIVFFNLVLLIILVASGGKGLAIIRKFILYIGVTASVVFISLETGVIYLTTLVFQLGDISTYERNKFTVPRGEKITKIFVSLLKLPFNIDGVPSICYCPLGSPLYSYWAQSLLIVSPVLMAITVTLIVGLVYFKVFNAFNLFGHQSDPAAIIEKGRTTSPGSKEPQKSSGHPTDEKIHTNNDTLLVALKPDVSFERQTSFIASSPMIEEATPPERTVSSIETVHQPSLHQEQLVQAIENPEFLQFEQQREPLFVPLLVVKPQLLSNSNNDTVIDMEFFDVIENSESNEKIFYHQSLETGNKPPIAPLQWSPFDEYLLSHESPPVLSAYNNPVGKLKPSQLEAFGGKAPAYQYKTNNPVGKLKTSHLDPFRVVAS